MAKILGIGGVFFKAKDPAKLAAWYKKWLKLEIDATFGGSIFQASSLPEKAYLVWSPFIESTEYFEPSKNPYMINFIVDNLEEALNQVKQGDGTLVGTPEDYDYGLFGWFIDPEGNKVELWQPK